MPDGLFGGPLSSGSTLGGYTYVLYDRSMLDRHRALNPAAQPALPPAEAQYCASLPSSTAAYRLLSEGSGQALVEVVGSTLLRGLLISSGLLVLDLAVGKKPTPMLLAQGAAGAGAIEVFVLGWTFWKMPR